MMAGFVGSAKMTLCDDATVRHYVSGRRVSKEEWQATFWGALEMMRPIFVISGFSTDSGVTEVRLKFSG